MSYPTSLHCKSRLSQSYASGETEAAIQVLQSFSAFLDTLGEAGQAGFGRIDSQPWWDMMSLLAHDWVEFLPDRREVEPEVPPMLRQRQEDIQAYIERLRQHPLDATRPSRLIEPGLGTSHLLPYRHQPAELGHEWNVDVVLAPWG